MAVKTREGKQTIDLPMLSVVEKDMRKDKEVVETGGELVEKAVKEAEVSQKVFPIPRPQPPFPWRLVKKAEDSKYRRFITMLK